LINQHWLPLMLLITLHNTAPAHHHGCGPPWWMVTNFWCYSVWADDFSTGRKMQFCVNLNSPLLG